MENTLGGIKCHSFLASSSPPKAKRKKKSTLSASLLVFALQNLFVCAGGKVPFGLSQHLHVWVRQLAVSALDGLRTGVSDQHFGTPELNSSAAAEGQQRQDPTAFQF